MIKYNFTDVISAEWIDKDTFLVCFTPITNDDNLTYQVVSEYHKDERKVVAELQIFESDGNFVETDIIVKDTHIFNIIKEITLMKMEKDNSCSFEVIFGKDGFKTHDAFVDLIVDYYSANNDSLADEVETEVNGTILNLLNKLDANYKN